MRIYIAAALILASCAQENIAYISRNEKNVDKSICVLILTDSSEYYVECYIGNIENKISSVSLIYSYAHERFDYLKIIPVEFIGSKGNSLVIRINDDKLKSSLLKSVSLKLKNGDVEHFSSFKYLKQTNDGYYYEVSPHKFNNQENQK